MLLRIRVSLHAIDAGSSGFSNFGRGSKGVAWGVKLASWKLTRAIVAKAIKDEPEWRGSDFVGKSWDPGLEMQVPFEQRPVSCKSFFVMLGIIL
jgi:hypothetical protein